MYICLCSRVFYSTLKSTVLCKNSLVPDVLQPSGGVEKQFWLAHYSGRACTDPDALSMSLVHLFLQSDHWRNSHAQHLHLWFKAHQQSSLCPSSFPPLGLAQVLLERNLLVLGAVWSYSSSIAGVGLWSLLRAPGVGHIPDVRRQISQGAQVPAGNWVWTLPGDNGPGN